MVNLKVSACGRFVVLDQLYVDRAIFQSVERWAREHGLRVQDAIQLALCGLLHGDVGGPPGEPARRWTAALARGESRG